MLLSLKIKKTIESEIKNQKALLKLIVAQETNYNSNYAKEKEDINKTIAYYEKILRDGN